MKRLSFYLAAVAAIGALSTALMLSRSTQQGPTELEAVRKPTTTTAVPSESSQDPFVLRDVGAELVLIIQLNTGRHDRGVFRFDAPEAGTYQGAVLVEARPHGRYKATGVDPNGSFISTTPGAPPAKVQIRVKGTFEPATGRAVAKVWVGPPDQPMSCGARDDQDDDLDDQQLDTDPEAGACHLPTIRYRLRSGNPSKQAAERAAEKTVHLMTDKRWDELYDMLPEAVKAGIAPEEFSANMTDSQPFKQITRSTNTAAGSLKATGGISYFSQPVTLEVQNHDGTTAKLATTLLYVFEEGEWRFASTTPPEPLP